MLAKQNFKSPKKQKDEEESRQKLAQPNTSKSFRSKMFQKRALKQIPKIADKQITLHTPLYEKYLQSDFKISDIGQVPHIWGCIIPERRKADSVRKNYLKRDIDTPKNLFRSYIKRKSKFIFGIPITAEFSIPKDDKSNESKSPEKENPEVEILQPEVSQFFTEVQQVSQTAREPEKNEQIKNMTTRQKVKRYDEEEHEEIRSSKFFSTKPTTSVYTSRFGESLMKNDGFLKTQQIRRINNKSVYNMSLQQLKESINWKKNFLNCLNQSLHETKRRQFKIIK